MKPNFYKQIDSRYSGIRGSGTTIGASGCGPTAVANVVSVLKSHRITPKHTFRWACNHGYMAGDNGLYWSGIAAMLKHYGIKGVTQTSSDEKALQALKKGYWVIGLVGRSIWTSGGHFILLYGYKNGYVYVSDSASYALYRKKNTFSTYRAASVQNWCIIDPRIVKGNAKSRAKAKKKAKAKTITMYVGATEGVNVRTKATTFSKRQGIMAFNTKVKLTIVNELWYKIADGKFKGYYVAQSEFSKYKQRKVKYQTLCIMNVRKGYSTKTNVIATIAKGKKLLSTKQRGRWAYFPKQSGLAHAGWVKIKSDKERYLKAVK